MASLEQLPTELHIMILKSLSLEDVASWMRTSRTLYQAFLGSRVHVLVETFDKSISSSARSHVTALQRLTSLGCFPSQDIVRGVLQKYFKPDRVDFSLDLASCSWTSLCEMIRRHIRLTKFAKHFAFYAISSIEHHDMMFARSAVEKEPHRYPKAEPKPRLPRESDILPYWATPQADQGDNRKIREKNVSLSTTETARIQRALYAHEIYSYIASTFKPNEDLEDFPYYRQDFLFLDIIPLFQVEEIASVHQYYMSMARVLFDKIERDLIKEAKSRSCATFDGLKQFGTMTYTAIERKQRRFCLDRDFHYHDVCEQAQKDASFLASRGARYFARVLIAPTDERLRLLIENFRTKRNTASSSLSNPSLDQHIVTSWHLWNFDGELSEDDSGSDSDEEELSENDSDSDSDEEEVSENDQDLDSNEEELPEDDQDSDPNENVLLDHFHPLDTDHYSLYYRYIRLNKLRTRISELLATDKTMDNPAESPNSDSSEQDLRQDSDELGAMYIEDPNVHAIGWHCYNYVDTRFRRSYFLDHPFRELGCVFWDLKRLEMDNFVRALCEKIRHYEKNPNGQGF